MNDEADRAGVRSWFEQMTRARLAAIPGVGRKVLAPPLPELVMGEFFWEGTTLLESWRGFIDASGPYGESDGSSSSGSVKLHVATQGEPIDAPPPAPSQIAAFRHLLEQETAIAAAVLDAILADPTTARGATTRAELTKRIGLAELHVNAVEKDGLAYLGFEFGTSPSSEHGIGVLTHQNRVALVGHADVSFVAWMAKKDGARDIF